MKKENSTIQTVLNICFIISSALIILPLLMLISISLTSERDIVYNGYSLIPPQIDFSAYKYIMADPSVVFDAYKVTIAFSVLGTIVQTFMTALIAYPLSQKAMPHRRMVSLYLYFTCLFSGGLVPTYILNTQYLHLGDNFLIYILPGCVGVMYVFMMRTFFQGIPDAIVESALIDGANDYQIFLKFIIPLSKPVIATVALMTFLGKWNDWYTSLLYIDNPKLISLQYLLQKILTNLELMQTSEFLQTVDRNAAIPSESLRMAMAVVVAGPALVVFPFFQKYFVKGLTVGSVKG